MRAIGIFCALIASAALGGCYYTSSASLLANNAASCGVMAGSWVVYDPEDMQGSSRPSPMAYATITSSPAGCRVQTRVMASSTRGPSHFFGASRNVVGLISLMHVHTLTQSQLSMDLSLVQLNTAAAPGVDFGVSTGARVYLVAAAAQLPGNSLVVTLMAPEPDCANPPCALYSLQAGRDMVMRQARAPQGDQRAVAILMRTS